MAVVGEANIIVKAVTTGFDAQLRRQLQQMAGTIGGAGRNAGESLGDAFARGFGRTSGNVFAKVAEGLNAMLPEAEAARLQFRSLVRTSYTLGTALTVLVGGISAVVGGLIVFVGALGRAAPAITGIVSALVQMRLAFAFAGFAMQGISGAVSRATQAQAGLGNTLRQVNEQFRQLRRDAESAAMSEKRAALELEKARNNLNRMLDLPPNNMARREAELALEEAELNYRQAKERTTDLNAELAKGKKGLMDQAGIDPYAGLTKSQKAFAKFLVGLNPKLDELREAVASGFLPVLQTQIEELVKFYFPDLLKKFGEVGDALGKGAINIADNFLDENTKKEVLTFFDNLNKNIPTIGDIIGELGEVLLKVFNDADGIGTKFLTFVLDTLKGWNEQLDKVGLEDLFARAYETGSQLFGIIGNIFDGLGDFFQILDESGAIDTVLGYLTDVTKAFAGIGENKEAGAAIGELFSGLANNFGPVLNFLGQLVTSFLKLGANPNIGKTFELLASPENAASWDTIFKSFADAGPAFALLVIEVGKLFAALSDAEAPKIFFDTLRQLIEPIVKFLQDPNNKAFVDTIGRIFAALTAIGFVLGGIRLGFLIFFGNISWAFGMIGKLVGKEGMIAKAFGGLKTFFGPTGAGGMIAGWARSQFDLAKAYADDFVKVAGPKIKDFAVKAGGFFKGLPNAIGGFVNTVVTKVLGGLGTVVKFIGGIFASIGRFLLAALGPVGIAIAIITAVIGALTWFFTQTEVGKKMWEDFTSFVSDAWKKTTENIGKGWDQIIGFFKNLGPNLGNIFKGIINTIIGFWEGLVNNIITGFNNGILAGINSIKINIPQWIRDGAAKIGLTLPANIGFNLPKIAKYKIPRLAEGGIVMPSPGGTLAQIAEAGRPERVEPLDANGLSKRDYAMIDALKETGSGINITVNPSPGMDERELAELVSRRIAFEIRKGIY